MIDVTCLFVVLLSADIARTKMIGKMAENASVLKRPTTIREEQLAVLCCIV